jgi:hypothetical protein
LESVNWIPLRAVLSWRFFSKCDLTSISFLIKFNKSSGKLLVSSFSSRILDILFPVEALTLFIPYVSRRINPILEVGLPDLANLITSFSTSFSLYGAQAGTFLIGFVEPLFPLSLLCILATILSPIASEVRHIALQA